MDSLSTENLFLLEFLVDNITMDNGCTVSTPPGDLCVSFQFLDNESLDVCEADFNKSGPSGENTKSGKSCLFSLTPEQVQSACEVFDVTITVFKKMQPGWLPDKICIGCALISVSNLFTELVKSVSCDSEVTPTAKTLKDSFALFDGDCCEVGKIGIYVRMSCFGKLIVTQFQMNVEDQSVLFKDKGGQSLYRYRKVKNPDEPQCIQDLAPGFDRNQPQPFPQQDQGFGQFPQNQNCPNMPCFPQGDSMFPPQGFMPDDMYGGGGPMMGQAMMPYNDMGGMGGFPPQQQQCTQMLTPCEECGTLLPPQFKSDVMACQSEMDDCKPGSYQEIGASMGGNALTIRVHKDKNKIEPVDCDSVDDSMDSFCNTLGSGGKKAPKQQSAKGGTPANLNFQPGVQQGNQNLPFSFKMSGCNPQNNVVVNPPVCTKPDGTKFTEISDPNKEMFILRIGKKSEGVQKKANLELELCTPRGPELKPIPKKETRDAQYDPNDCPADGKGKKKKGGKAKGKKGKKK